MKTFYMYNAKYGRTYAWAQVLQYGNVRILYPKMVTQNWPTIAEDMECHSYYGSIVRQ